MNTMLIRSILPLLFAAAMLATAPPANAQSGKDAKAEPGADAKTEKKMLVTVMSIENGDTTITEHEVDPDDSEVSWVEKDDEGKEKQILIKKELAGSDSKHSGMACCEAKESADRKERAGKDCCAGGKHGSMESKEMNGMHGRIGSKEVKEMHGKMSSKEMKEMHNQMMKEREGKDGDEDENADTDETEDQDDDDGGMDLR